MKKFKIGDKVLSKRTGDEYIIKNISETCSKCGGYKVDVGIGTERLERYYACDNCCGEATPFGYIHWFSPEKFELKFKKILFL